MTTNQQRSLIYRETLDHQRHSLWAAHGKCTARIVLDGRRNRRPALRTYQRPDTNSGMALAVVETETSLLPPRCDGWWGTLHSGVNVDTVTWVIRREREAVKTIDGRTACRWCEGGRERNEGRDGTVLVCLSGICYRHCQRSLQAIIAMRSSSDDERERR